MRKVLMTLLTLSTLAFAYGPGPEHEMEHSFQEGVKNPGYSAGAKHEVEKSFETPRKDPGYTSGAEHEMPAKPKKKKEKSKK